MKIKLNQPIAVIVALLLSCSNLFSQVMRYRQLPEFALSSIFNVEIKQGNTDFESNFTYGIPNTESGIVTKVEHISMFAFEPVTGPIDIRITSKTGVSFSSSNIELVNKMYQGIEVSFENGAMLLKVNQPKKQLFVRLKSDYGNPLMLLVDPIQESEIPANAKVVRFAASSTPYIQTAQYDRYSVPNDVDIVYIEDGALIKGTIHTSSGRTKPLKIMGRGMLIGKGNIVSGTTGIPYNTLEIADGNNHVVEGITVLKSRHFGLRISDNALVDNVKMFGYNANNDGIVAGKNSVISNCFLKVNDDNIKLYYDNVKVQNVVFYAQQNGAIIQFAWNSVDPGDNCLVENCEVVAVEYTGCGDPVSGTGGVAHCFISLREEESDGKKLQNDTIRNIIIQGNLIRFMGVNGYEYKGIDIAGLVVQNINVIKAPTSYSWVYTKNPYSMGIKFENVVVGTRAIALSDFHTLGTVNLEFDGIVNPFVGKMAEPYNIIDVGVPLLSSSNRIKCFPNPVKNQLTLEFSPANAVKPYTIFSMNGQKIASGEIDFSKGSAQISTEKLSSGYYLISVDSEIVKIQK